MQRSKRKKEFSTLSFKLWDFSGTALLNLFMLIFVAAYLSPLPFMVIASLTPRDQFLDANAPILPSTREKFTYEGDELIVYKVPTEGGEKEWALYKKGRQSSEFIDPNNVEVGPIVWEGSWRTLVGVYKFQPTLKNYKEFASTSKIPLYFKNTIIVAFISEVGVLRTEKFV